MKSVKEAAQQVLKEEDCSKNCNIFGLVEEPAEENSSVVSGMMESIRMKPEIQALRLGVQKTRWLVTVQNLAPLKSTF